MSDASFTFRLDEALKDEFTDAAKTRDRSGAQLLRDFMRDFVKQQKETADRDAWFRAQVQAGIDSANVGQLVSAKAVETEFAVRRSATLRKLGKAAK
jgi:predicted transcriptional regulator